jgi:nitrite reductase (NO-forming)/hydroxylamine reductase
MQGHIEKSVHSGRKIYLREHPMKALKIPIPLIVAALFLSGCVGQVMTPYPFMEEKAVETSQPAAQEAAAELVVEETAVEPVDRELALAGLQKGGCGGCHVIPGAPGATGVLATDLSRMGEIGAERVQGKGYDGRTISVEGYITEALLEPDAYLSPECGGNPCPKGLMPASLTQALSEGELRAVIGYLSALPDAE